MLMMKKITRKKHLEMKIESIPAHPKPKVNLEQYSTPADIASDVLWNALTLGDIEQKNIVDLGCGCGIFAIGSALLGAKSVIGVDIDGDAIESASAAAFEFDINNIDFITSDISDFHTDLNVDCIFQNPPFGSQRNADSGADLNFVNKAGDLSSKVLYSFHMASTLDFLISYYDKCDFKVTHVFRYDFPIPKIYKFHTKDSVNVEAVVLRAEL